MANSVYFAGNLSEKSIMAMVSIFELFYYYRICDA